MSNVSYINVNGHLYPFDDPQLTEEVENIRIGADGKQYGSAGDALRSQLDDINDGLETAQNNITQIYGEQDSEKENVSQAQGDITTLQNDASTLATDISNVNSGLAPAFSESTTYAIGDYCMHNGTLYKAVAEHTGAWTDADFEAVPVGGELEAVNAETAEAQEITQTVSGNKMGALIDTASGSIASFYPDSTIPTVKGLTVNVEPVQDLHGYDSPWPAGGGKNKLNPLATYKGCEYNTAVGTTLNPVAADKSWQDAGNDTFTISNLGSWSQACLISDPLPLGKAYLKISNVRGAVKCSVYVCNGDFKVNRVSFIRNPVLEGDTITVNTTFTNDDTYFVVYLAGSGADASIQYPYAYSGDTAATDSFSPYSNICPISGWMGLSVYVGATQDPDDATVYNVDWSTQAGTVYGGTLDVTNGVLTVDRAMVDLGTLDWTGEDSYLQGMARATTGVAGLGAVYYQTPLCSTLKGTSPKSYSLVEMGTVCFSNSPSTPFMRVRSQIFLGLSDAEIKTALTGVQFVYELATPIEIQLTPNEVAVITGQTNNIWADSGNVSVEYAADLKTYIDQKIAAAVAALS